MLGSTTTASVLVEGGEFAECYHLSTILTRPGGGAGYDNTPNNGGEYKVWVSQDPTFPGRATKTDNFKAPDDDPEEPPCPAEPCQPPADQATLRVRKFYDANANGVNDGGPSEPFLDGWEMRIRDGIDLIRYTPVDVVVAPDTYFVTESAPVETNWVRTTTPAEHQVALANGDDVTVTFGNVCLGAGGGHTLGFWSNKNGQALIDAGDRQALADLNLRNADGSDFPTPPNVPTSAQIRTWLLNGNATNMAYMLSVQLAAMVLNVRNGFVDPGALIYDGTNFVTVQSVIDAANTTLGADGLTLAGDPNRATQEQLKNTLDAANNNQNFVQATPCPYSFDSDGIQNQTLSADSEKKKHRRHGRRHRQRARR